MLVEVFLASRNGDVNAIKKLYGQNPKDVTDGVTFERNTVLHIAAREGHLEFVEWILKNLKCCIAKARNADKNTPLHEAAKGGNEEVIKILLRYNKCAASKRNQFGETALIIASENGHEKTVEVLLDLTPWFMILWPRNDRQTCLHVAAYEGHLGVVQLILKRRTYFNIMPLICLISDGYGGTPLHSAVHGGHIDIVLEIVKIKLNLYCCIKWLDKSLMTKNDEFGRCPIHVASLKGDEEIIEKFMQIMPDSIEIRSRDLKTALHFAVEYNQFKVVQKLLFYTMPREAAKLVSCDRDISGNTTLHLAAKKGVDPQLLTQLLSFPNIKVNGVNGEGLTALDIATGVESRDNPNYGMIARILEEAGATHSSIHPSNPQASEQSKENGGSSDTVMSVDTLVASLVATVTFAAIFTVPGGTGPINHEGGRSKKYGTENGKVAKNEVAENEVVANMGLQTLFQVFLFSDCLAFFASMTVVVAWIFRERLQGKLSLDRSPLARLSLLSLELSIMCTALAFISATMLVTIPRDLEKRRSEFDEHNFEEYKIIFASEILTASLVPAGAIMFLFLAWAYEYWFRATNYYQRKLKTQLHQVVIYIIPPCLLIFGVMVVYGLNQVK